MGTVVKNKKPIFVIWNDIHLGTGNEDAVLVSTNHIISYMLENQLDTLVFAGDFFHSRTNQTENVLNTANKILEYIHSVGIRHILIPGNHDRTSYFSYTSFLDVFSYHPGVELYTKTTNIDIKGVKVTLLPFFDDSMLVPMIEESEGGDILISHFEMAGSSHLGKVSEKTSITKTSLKKWKKTYLGHYHNTHEISRNIVHLPSLRQSSFGEDSLKGFSVIYDDLSYEIIPGVFKKFNKLTLDINELSNEDIKELIKVHKDSPDTVRFEFEGTESRLKALDKEQFIGTGIDVKLKFEKIYSVQEVELPILIKKFDKEQIFINFQQFCEEKEYSHGEGLVLLNEYFTNKEK